MWSWWPSSAAAWGVSGLTPAVALAELVNVAITRQATVIELPRTDLSLDFGSVQALRPMGARLLWRGGESLWTQATADCQAGLLNGMPPQAAAGAELLTAACQVAYGAP